MGKRIGVYKYIHALPRDAYGNRYHIGGRILSQKFGLGTVIGVARGGDGRTCVVCNFRAAYREGGVAVAWCESFDKAVAVCDALTLGAKASGFAATYDVVEVKKWTA